MTESSDPQLHLKKKARRRLVGAVAIAGLAAVILGEAVLSTRTILLAAIGCVFGSILYRLAVAFALNAEVLGLQAQDLKLITALLVVLAMSLPTLRRRWHNARTRR